jgi:hypothetical protein
MHTAPLHVVGGHDPLGYVVQQHWRKTDWACSAIACRLHRLLHLALILMLLT